MQQLESSSSPRRSDPPPRRARFVGRGLVVAVAVAVAFGVCCFVPDRVAVAAAAFAESLKTRQHSCFEPTSSSSYSTTNRRGPRGASSSSSARRPLLLFGTSSSPSAPSSDASSLSSDLHDEPSLPTKYRSKVPNERHITSGEEPAAAKVVSVYHPEAHHTSRRRTVLGQVLASALVAVTATTTTSVVINTASLSSSNVAWADSGGSEEARYVYRDVEQGFQFAPPTGFVQTAKPLPTHLKEVQFAPSEEEKDGISSLPKSYQYGITVDPVRIDSLRQFGTPQEVAAKVVTAELNRDGVFVVTLMKDPVEQADENVLGYVLNYKSQGKRGDKRFVCKFFIAQNRLYALTAQCKEDDYDQFKHDMDDAVKSFTLLQQAASSSSSSATL